MRVVDPPVLRLPEPRRSWYRWVFWAATVYNTIWGVVVILLPAATLGLVGIETDAIGLLFWQCIGMFVLVFALGYAAAAMDPERYAPFILIATLGKIFGPIGFLYGAFWLGVLPKSLGFTILTNDLAWWPAFFPFVWETCLKRRRA
jgi:hypothetical protein